MKLSDIVKNIKAIIQEIATKGGFLNGLNLYNGYCLCAKYSENGVNIETHCWRTGKCCKYSGIHVWLDPDWTDKLEENKKLLKKLARVVRRDIKEYWPNITISIRYNAPQWADISYLHNYNVKALLNK